MAGLTAVHRALARRQARGVIPTAARGLLRLAAFPYEAVVRTRNAAYDRGWLTTYRPGIPVVSVGNLTAGGVGKTPFVETMVTWLTESGRSPVIVSRGYKGRGGENDEAMLLRQNLPSTPHVQNPDRVAAAAEAASKRLGDVIVLDDGFQHRRLGRTVDVVLIDATNPFGEERLLPAGFLREPVSSLARADAVVLTRVGLVDDETRAVIRRRVATQAPSAVWAEVDFQPTGWMGASDGMAPIQLLRGDRLFAFCGLGNPEAYRRTLDHLKMTVVGFESFPDHHAYSARDLCRLAERASSCGAGALVATQKDAVKIPADGFGGLPFYALRIATVFVSGEAELRHLIAERVAGIGCA